MIDFYAMGSPNVVKVYIALEELGLPYTVHPIDVFGNAQFSPEFLKLNPNAKVPVIIDHDGPGGKPYTVFESGAILIYLAEKSGKLLAKDGAARYDALQWLMVQTTGLGPMSGQLVHFVRFAPKEVDNSYALSRYKTQVATVYKTLEGRLSESKYLGGSEYSIADIATFPWARVFDMLLGEAAKPAHPHLTRWLADIAQRPAVIKALAAVENVRAKTSTPDKVTSEQLDRVFGRGKFAVA
jgi:GST-like protein